MTMQIATEHATKTKTARPKSRVSSAGNLPGDRAAELVERMVDVFRAHAEGYTHPDGGSVSERGFERRGDLLLRFSDDERGLLAAVCSTMGLVASRPITRKKGRSKRV